MASTYEEVRPIRREDAQVSFESADVSKICDALVRVAFHEPDWRWIQMRCLEFCKHESAEVRGIAVTCIGHIARIHSELDLDLVLPVLDELRSDEQMGGRVQDTIDDIATFVGE